jgi:hypothetical protein
MDGVPYDVKPSAPVEAAVLVMESEAVVEAETMVESVTAPIWGLQQQQQPLWTVSTMRTVPELSLDVSGAKGTNAEKGVSGRDGDSAGQHGESGSDASQAVAGTNAGRVVLYMSTTAAASQRGDSAAAPPIKSLYGDGSYKQNNDVVVTDGVMDNGTYQGRILVQYSMPNAWSTSTSDQQSVYLVPQLQPESRACGRLTLSRSAIKIVAVGGKGGNGSDGGNGGSGAKGRPGQVSITTLHNFHSCYR